MHKHSAALLSPAAAHAQVTLFHYRKTGETPFCRLHSAGLHYTDRVWWQWSDSALTVHVSCTI